MTETEKQAVQGEWGRKGASVLAIRLRLRLAVKRIMLDNLCMGAYAQIVAGKTRSVA